MKYNAYFPLSEDRIQFLIMENEEEINSDIDEKLKRTLVDRNNKLKRLVKYMKANSEKDVTKFEIGLTEKGMGILQGVQIPLYKPKEIEKIINIELVIDENIQYNMNAEKARRSGRFNQIKEEFKLWLTTFDIAKIERHSLEYMLLRMQRAHIKYLLIGSKLFVIYNEVPGSNPYQNADGHSDRIRQETDIVKRLISYGACILQKKEIRMF